MPGLNARQSRFVEEYLIDLNATQAAVRAGYSRKTAEQIGSRLLRNVQVASAVRSAQAERSKRTKVTADRVLEELARLGFSDMRKFVDWGPNGVTLKDSAALDDDAARCVSEVSETTSKDGGSIKFKLHDKAAALANIGRHLGMFADKVEVTGKDGASLAPQVWVVGGKTIVF